MLLNFNRLYRNKKHIGAFCTLFIVILVCTGFTYENPIDFTHITDEEGLSHESVYSIIQDKDGFMWFGTEDGLNKYDGYTMKIYKREAFNDDSLQCANCSALYVDESDSIWIASWGGGVEVLNPRSDKITSYLNDPNNPNSISDNNVQTIFKDSRGKLWFGTYTKGLNEFDPKTGKFKAYLNDKNDKDSISANRIWSIKEDTDGALLIGTSSGLDKLYPGSKKFIHYDKYIKNRVRVIYKDSKNTLWLGTQDGLCSFDTAKGNCKYYLSGLEDSTTNTITSILEDSRGVLWVGTTNGLNILNKENGVLTRYENDPSDPNSLSNNDIRALYEDLSGNVWICTRGGGIDKVDIKPRKFKYFSNSKNDVDSLSDNFVVSVFEDKSGTVWVGTKKGGLNKLDLRTGCFTSYMSDYKKDETHALVSICEDTDDSIWVGSLYGLNRFNKKTGKYITYRNDPKDSASLSGNTVLSVFKDHLGILWVGTQDGGLNQYDPYTDKFTHYTTDSNNPSSISGNTVNSIYEDKKGLLWIATQNGLNSFDRRSKKFTRYNLIKDNPNSISDNQINCIYEDSKYNLWIGTQSGLNKFDRQKNAFTLYTMENGLPNNVIHGIVEDNNGHIWLTTNHGLSVFKPDKEIFKNYNSFDGLQGNGYNNMACIKLSTGEILLGGIKGLDYFDPQNVLDSTFLPPIAITSCKIMDNNIRPDFLFKDNSGLNLTYKDIIFALEFSSLDYTKPEKNQYAYKLEGFDKDWNYTGSRRYLSYTNLPSGNYKLILKGTNCDGIWNEGGTIIPIKVAPPPWKTWWAYMSYLIMAIGIIYFYMKYSANKREKETEQKVQSMIMSLSATLDINEVLEKFLDSFMKIIPYSNALVIIKEGDTFKISAAAGESIDKASEKIKNKAKLDKIMEIIEKNKLPYIPKEDSSELYIPIIYNGFVEGIVMLEKKAPNSYGLKESSMGFVFASQAGYALKNADLYEELKLAMKNISETQEQLIQSEKMAALGQLIAGIAHEINNPLGAIQASISNSMEYIQKLPKDIEILSKDLNKEQYDAFKVLISRSLQNKVIFTTAEARKYRRKLSGFLEESGVEEYEDIADILVDMGISDNIEPFMMLFTSNKNKEIIKTCYNISGLQRNSLNIKSAVDRAAKIVYALKNYARSSSEESFVSANIIEGIETVLTIYNNQIKQSTEVVKNFSTIPDIMCSPDQLSQVWTNIIYNGLQAMDNKGKLEIEAFTDKQNIVVKITDSGKGIPENIKDKIFEPFFTTKPQGEGTGLGLHIVKKIIDRHNGEIKVESIPGRTSFIIKLPINR